MIGKPASPAELVNPVAIGKPYSPNEPQTCQHLRIDNASACCAKCSEQMVAWTMEARTVLSAPNINPCTNPEHLAALAAGEPVDCDAVYVPGPARTVVIGYEPSYQCSRCSHSYDLIEGTVFVPDCGHSHRGDLIRAER